MLPLLGLAFKAQWNLQCQKFIGRCKYAKVNDYNLEIVEVTNAVTEAKENSFPNVTSALMVHT